MRESKIDDSVILYRSSPSYQDAEPISSIGYDEIFPHSIRLAWESQSPTFKIMYTEKGKDAWRAANDGQGLEYWGGNTINIYGLIESTTYLFKVFAGNRFSFETTGLGMEATTISRRKQDGMRIMIF